MMRQRQRELVLVLVAFLLVSQSARAQFRGYCSLAQEPIVQIGRDEATGQFRVVEGSGRRRTSPLPPLNPPRRRENLAFWPRWSTNQESSLVGTNGESSFHDGDADDESTRRMGESIPAVDALARHLDDSPQHNAGDNDLVEVRRCYCAYANYYCPLDKDYCGIPRYNRKSQVPGCVNRNKQQVFVRSIWIYLIVWFAIIVAIIVCTPWGRTALLSLGGFCICGFRECWADRMLRRNPDRATYFIRRNLQRRRQAIERRYRRITGETLPVAMPVLDTVNGETPTANALVEQESVKPPKSLVLRTRRYKKDAVVHSQSGDAGIDDDDEADAMDACTICFAPLEDGDRVGALPCNHMFHSVCLKEWLKRRNTCPLCQETNVATPRYEEDDAIMIASNVEEAANVSQILEPSDTVETTD